MDILFIKVIMILYKMFPMFDAILCFWKQINSKEYTCQFIAESKGIKTGNDCTIRLCGIIFNCEG